MCSFVGHVLGRDKSVTVHHKNIHFLAIELYKVKHEISLPFMAEIFKQRIIPNDSVICGLRCPISIIMSTLKVSIVDLKH